MTILRQGAHWILLFWCASGLSLADSVTPVDIARVLQSLAPTPNLPPQESVSALYLASDQQLIWTDPLLYRQLQDGIEDSYLDGLNTADYRPTLATNNSSGSVSRVDSDIATSIGFLTLLRHLQSGKVDPGTVHADWNISRASRPDSDLQAAQAIRDRNVTGLLQSARPQQALYQQLRLGLARYRSIEAAGGWPPVISSTIIRPGDAGPAIVQLRRRLAITGDYYPSPADIDSPRFDPQLVDATKRFQQRHLLPEDGIIGPDTLSALIQPVQQKIDQIRANLERMRWLLGDLQGDYLLVDIAGYKLFLVQDDVVTWSSPIQVGKPYRQTPVLTSRITYLEWNPGWVVPPTIATEDVVPAIKRDPSYLQRHHMDLFTFGGKPVDPASVNWNHYPERPLPFMIRQRPGPWNALGTVKFIFPNKHLVYLHDTPDKTLFGRSNRAFSSGCIRVAKPYALAKLLLGLDSDTGDAMIRSIVASGKTQRQYLPEGFPVVLFYWTTKADADGSLVFAPDIYHRDTVVLQALDSQQTPGAMLQEGALVQTRLSGLL
jgi:murein L,D-transpeptidase YcbB/YkuD